MVFISFSLCLTGCSVLFPDRTAPKSSAYLVTPPNEPWHKIQISDDPNAQDMLKADLAYENSESGAMISLNSLCRKYNTSSLKELSLNLVRGIDNRNTIEEKTRKINGAEALDTLYEGIVDNVPLRIQTIVLVKNYCTYDFIYVAVPAKEKNSHVAFDEFINSFKAE